MSGPVDRSATPSECQDVFLLHNYMPLTIHLRAVLSCVGVVGKVRLVHLGSVVAAFVVLLRLFLLGSILSVKKMRNNSKQHTPSLNCII